MRACEKVRFWRDGAKTLLSMLTCPYKKAHRRVLRREGRHEEITLLLADKLCFTESTRGRSRARMALVPRNVLSNSFGDDGDVVYPILGKYARAVAIGE
jgi:uncharacterized protein YbaR (Trm112 family)